MSANSSKIGASILNQSAKQAGSEQSNKQSMGDKKNRALMSTPKMKNATSPYSISGFSNTAGNNSIKKANIRVPIPKNMSTDKSEPKEFVIGSCESLKSSVPKGGNQFKNIL